MNTIHAKRQIITLFLYAFFGLYCSWGLAYDETEEKASHLCDKQLQFTFSWSIHADCQAFLPRGGTSKGAAVTLDPKPHEGWLALQEPGLDTFEKDRRAILAMAGPYRTSFDFLEVVGYTTDFKADRPYQSWGTEYVYVAEDSGDFISLQHIMVMYFQDGDKVSKPVVMKHWRQDWKFQKRTLLTYSGNETWTKTKHPRKSVKGRWSQAVYQVDDSPRYEALGQWQHHANFSTWISDKTWRPLPRREHSVRNDYQVLEGTNRHTIVPTGWVQEEENYKVVLDTSGELIATLPYLAKELGLNRYERVIDFDFSAGDQYWNATTNYWKDVRQVWQEIIEKNKSIHIKKRVDNTPLFMPMFEYAEKMRTQKYVTQDGVAHIKNTLNKYVSPNTP